MTAEELETLIASGEGETLEVKETTGQRVETLCAFLNKGGGAVEGTKATEATEGTQATSDKETTAPLNPFSSLGSLSSLSSLEGGANV